VGLVQTKLSENASGTSRRLRSQQPSLLVGLVFDGEGRAMTPSHATKPGKRYRYYVTRSDQIDDAPAWRVSAHDLERLVCERLAELLGDQLLICRLVGEGDAEAVQRIIAAGDLAAASLRSGSAHAKSTLLMALVERISLSEGGIAIRTSRGRIGAAFGIQGAAIVQDEDITLNLPATKVRRGHQLRFVIPGPEHLNIIPAQRDEKLVALVAEAHEARKLIIANPEQSLASIAAASGRCRTRLGKLVALACMAPEIVTAIVEGRQPSTLIARSLMDIELPIAWADQRAMLGFT